MGLESYYQWKKQKKTVNVSEQADQLLEEAFFHILEPEESGKGVDVAGSNLPEVLPSIKSQKKMMELSKLLFKIESIQRLYRAAVDSGSKEELEKCKTILEALFDLAHMKLNDAEVVFFGKEDLEEAPEEEDEVEELPSEPQKAEEVISLV